MIANILAVTSRCTPLRISLRTSLRLSSLVLLLSLAQALLVSNAIADSTSSQGTPKLAIAMLAAETRFDSNTMNLTPAGQRSLNDLIDQLAKYHEILSFRIIGHTDNIGSNAFNQTLSLQRANSIRESLVKNFPNAHLLSVGMGELQPIAKNDTEAGRERNRRVEIQVIARGFMPISGGNSATNN